jgi:hypothetical protein
MLRVTGGGAGIRVGWGLGFGWLAGRGGVGGGLGGGGGRVGGWVGSPPRGEFFLKSGGPFNSFLKDSGSPPPGGCLKRGLARPILVGNFLISANFGQCYNYVMEAFCTSLKPFLPRSLSLQICLHSSRINFVPLQCRYFESMTIIL